jgi:hypothetical protein
MSRVTTTGFARSVNRHRTAWMNDVPRLLWRLLAALDRLVQPCDPAREPDPPPEWFKYPPF